jgi:arylsulfatase A-like enzyme/acetyl esterase/lipase
MWWRFARTPSVLLFAVLSLPSGVSAAPARVAPVLTDVAVGHESRVYRSTPQGDLALHFSLPPDWKPSDRRPAIVFFFGGGWKSGSHRQFVPQADYFAARGMVAAAADYRILSVHGTGPEACIADAKAAVRWLRRHAGELGIDPGRVVAAGGSAGGHLAAATALVPGFDDDPDAAAGPSAKPDALVLFNPALNIDEIAAERRPDLEPTRAAALSPNRFIDRGAPPAIMFFGTDDALLDGAEKYLARAGELGLRAELCTAAGQPHGFFNRSPWAESTVRRADEFLASLGFLAGPPAVHVPEGTPPLVERTAAPAASIPTGSAPAGKVTGLSRPPNIVVFLFDDLGWGQPQCYDPASQLRTPHLDRLATEGMRFTDAHAAAAVCTPTRYGLLTGRYPWRIGQFGVLTSYSSPIIPPTRATVASFLRGQGYHTACIGKWHLGLEWADGIPGADDRRQAGADDRVPIGARVASGPLGLGFDTFCGFTHARNIGTVIEQDRVVSHVADEANQPLMLDKTLEYLAARAADARPFFLYVPVCPPHTPVVPAAEFRGTSGGRDAVKNDPLYADWVFQGDAMLGRIVAALDRHGLAADTLVMVSSDNGAEGRSYPPWRDAKRSIHEGGHRVPLVARWPGRVAPGSTWEHPVCLNDLFATAAEIVAAPVPPEAAEDSVSFLPALFGTSAEPTREATVHQSLSGDLAIRRGQWKLILPKKGEPKLFDLAADPGERAPVTDRADVAADLLALMQRYVAEGRSTPGPRQANEVRAEKLPVPQPDDTADAPAAAVATDVARDVLPVFRRHCRECHGADVQESGLRLDDHRAALAGGDSGPAIVPGDPTASELLRRVRLPRDDSEAMPPQGAGLSAAEIAALERWIAAGAAWPEGLVEERHWAYVPPRRPPLPHDPAKAVSAASAVAPIDAFVAAAHRRHGLGFAPESPRAVLARRASFDLTGLPPSVEAVAAFEADPRPDAYERYVDGLLESPEFGVRWARMWLDLARYADSHGFQRDDLRDVWAYRDWVVDALNADMPFDRFTIEQVAGDLLPDADERTRIATGFHRCTPTNVEAGTDPEESRMNQVFDRVNTTGAVWLGATLECAQCHDHKYDPFPQADYYRLAAYFNSTEAEADRANPKVPGSIRFVGPALPLSEDPLAAERAALDTQLREARKELRQLAAAAAAEPPADAVAAVGVDTTCGGDADAAPDAADADADADVSAPRRRRKTATPPADPAVAALEKRVKLLQQRLTELPRAETLVMRELDTQRETFVLGRGELSSRGATVAPGTPAVLGATPAGPANRLTLATWLVSRDNPLTARVIVNRVWHEIFGRGIVTTVEDFGVKGEPPSHPDLLDHLAVDLMDEGWSLKRLIRRIVTSRTYRQDSRATPDLLSRDPDNIWLARGPRVRLDAEGIRDNALAIAGLVSLGKGGPPVRPPQPDGLWAKVGGQQYLYETSPGELRHRRGLYVVLKRGSPYPSFAAFDASARMTCVVRRSRSNTPLQALVLLNDPVYAEAALAFARRMLHERPAAGDRERIAHAVRLAVARPPEDREIDVLMALLTAERQALAADPDRAAALVAAHPDVQPLAGVSAAELAAWYAVATAIMNLDETITKG